MVSHPLIKKQDFNLIKLQTHWLIDELRQ